MTDDVKRLRYLSRENLSMRCRDACEHEECAAETRDAALFNRAADALALLDTARGKVPLVTETAEMMSASGERLVGRFATWTEDFAGEEGPTPAESRRAFAHRLIATALAMLEADRG